MAVFLGLAPGRGAARRARSRPDRGRPAEARRRERNESSKALGEPWPLDAWPETPTRYLVCRGDGMFPAAWERRHARERLGIEADEIDGGHYVSLSRPIELADRLAAYLGASGAQPSTWCPVDAGSRSWG